MCAFQPPSMTSVNGTVTAQYIQKLGESVGPRSDDEEKSNIDVLNMDYYMSAKIFQFSTSHGSNEKRYSPVRTAISIAGRKTIPRTASAVMEELSLFAAFAI